MPTARVKDVDLPEARARNDLATARLGPSSILTPGTDVEAPAGTSIGLLLTLTYANNITLSTAATFIGEQPRARIRNID